MTRSFTLRLAIVILGSAILATIIAPVAAAIVAAIGFHFPFPRIFDRTVMVLVAIALIAQWRELRVLPMLRGGFRHPMRNLPRATRGFLIAIAAIATLVYVAVFLGAHADETSSGIWSAIPQYLVAAVVIAIIEEGFFRAVLMTGMEDDFGRTPALLLSSAIYALAHLVRSPAKFYLTGFHPLAGLEVLGMSLAHAANFGATLPTFVGLFLLGIVLGEAFLETGTVYFSIGLHAGFVLGAKLWPRMTAAGVTLPGWLRGWGSQPLISGIAAWMIAIAILLLIRPLSRARHS
ncbi:MAG TPA: CPBP family intramembrane glutamic endopeptidase [Candidatus Binataceae bacterium]|nr:CPBP family intramembrane glutamic endopeptidase [Candidatus Binataceae bacterium]